MKVFKNVPSLEKRWVIKGTLTTVSPLHIGDGQELEMTVRRPSAVKKVSEPTASTVATDHRRRAFIPASALKGSLRAAAKARALPRWEELFGLESAEVGQGGQLEFGDCFIQGEPPTFPNRQKQTGEFRTADETFDISGKPAYWSSERLTGVVVSVSLDRRTRTAKDKLLYHLEYVPAGVRFSFELFADNIEEESVHSVLSLLDGFNEPRDPITLGGQASNSWGRMNWKLLKVHSIDSQAIQERLSTWLKNPADMPCGADLYTMDLTEKFQQQPRAILNAQTMRVITLQLHFPGPLLVRDPQQPERAKRGDLGSGQKPPDSTPILDEKGLPFIPAKSLRGALRARAEMVMRTLGHDIPEPSELPHISELAEDAKQTATSDQRQARQYAVNLDPVSKLFGAPGWRAPVKIGDFNFIGEDSAGLKVLPHYHWQEFVAIDRFTGGGAEGRKFNARSIINAAFEGSVSLDIARLEKCGAAHYALGLLSLVLRDLAEGDLVLGSKGTVGYGVCRVTFSSATTFEAWAEGQSGLMNSLKCLDALKTTSRKS